MVKFGIIGCGNIARFHFNGIEKAGAQVTYIADLYEETAKPWLEKTGAMFTRDYKEVIASDEVDVVSVLVSGSLHKEICLAALAAGKDVVCEKTMTNTPDEAEAVAKAVAAGSNLFFTTYMKRFFPAVKKGKELMSSLGRVISAHVRSYQAWGDFYTTGSLQWAGDVTRKYGGAVLKCAGSHMLDTMMYFLGRPEYVYSYMDYLPDTDFDRKATALFEFKDGVTASFEAMTHPLSRIGYERNSWDEKIEINGVNGRIEIYTVMWDRPENNGALLVYYDNETQTSTEYRFAAMNPFDDEVAAIVRAVEERKQIHPDVIDGFCVDAVIGAMKESSEKKSAVKLNWRGL